MHDNPLSRPVYPAYASRSTDNFWLIWADYRQKSDSHEVSLFKNNLLCNFEFSVLDYLIATDNPKV